MNKKLLNEDNILNELKGGSSFFNRRPDSPAVEDFQKPRAPIAVMPLETSQPVKVETTPSLEENSQFAQHTRQGNEKASSMPISPDSANASVLALYPESLIDNLRKIVKSTGKEVSFVRLTPEEKKQLVDIVYTYKSQGVKTSETEINRIAVNYMLEDYKTHGQTSLLAQVIAAMLA